MADIQRTNYAVYSPGATSSTVSFTTSSYYRLLVVGVVCGSSSGSPVISTITYGGVAMTSLGSQQLNTVQRTATFFYLIDPLIGANDVVIATSSGHLVEDVIVASYKNVIQTSPVDVATSGLDGSSPATWNLTTTTTDALAVSYLAGYSGLTGYTNGTNISYFSADGTRRMGESLSLGASGSKSFSTVFSGGGSTAYFSAAFKLAVTIPILNTLTYDNLAQTSVRALSEVLYDGDATITERGFVYNTVTLPTTANSKKVVTGTVGAYTGDITGLTVNTTYYVRAYAINANGTAYSNEVTFTTLNIPQYELQYELGASDGDTYIGQINVTGTVGTITVQLGSTGTSTVINAGAGATTFTGTYSGLSGLIITRSADFNGTIDNVYYAKVPLGTTIDWTLNTVAITTSIPSEVFFKRVEDQIFNNFRFYRYLDLLFKDLDGYVTVTVRQEREDNTTEKSKVFVVGNTGSGTVSPFQKKRISFLCKDQAIIIGLSNDNLNETFSIAQYLLIGDKKPRRTISPSKIISIS